MAGISKKRYKTKKGIETRYTITYRDVFGKQHTSGCYLTQKEAKKELWKYDDINVDNTITYGFMFQNFLKKVKNKNSENTYNNYERYYNMYFRKYDNIEYQKVNSLHWQDFFDSIESPHVSALCLKMAKASANLLIKHDLLEKNVFSKVETKKPPKPNIKHLTVNQLKYLLEECKRSYPQYYALLYTFIGTGAREGEIFALNKDDFIDNTIRINKQFTQNKLYNHPKTASSNRIIHIFDDLAEVLREHVKTLKGDLLFPNRAGGYYNASNIRERFFYPLLELCGLPKIRLHDLRGSYIDMILSSGLSVKFAQNKVGHSKSETTLNVYARNNDDMITIATDKINSIFTKCEQNVSIIKNEPNKKIIPFRKKQTGIKF